jgi:hypothetical protein
MCRDEDARPASYVCRGHQAHPRRLSRLCLIHILEPTTHHRPDEEGETGKDSSKLLREIWGDGAYITNSDFGRDSAIEVVEKEGGLVSFARHFISNVSKRFPLPTFIDAQGR